MATAVAAMLVITITVLTLSLAMQRHNGPAKLPSDDENGGQNQPVPDNGSTNLPGRNNNSQNPENNNGDKDPAGDGQQTVVPVPDDPVWTSPVEGYVFKQHSTDELVYSLTLGDYRTHEGIDISALAGSEVKACLDGKIESVYYDPMMGYCVSIDHEDGMVSHYKNLGETLPEGVVEGKEVKSGEVIGYVGESAMIEFSDEAHLHFELEVSGEATDPLEYLEYSDKPSDVESE